MDGRPPVMYRVYLWSLSARRFIGLWQFLREVEQGQSWYFDCLDSEWDG